jgi:hypothetical protein
MTAPFDESAGQLQYVCHHHQGHLQVESSDHLRSWHAETCYRWVWRFRRTEQFGIHTFPSVLVTYRECVSCLSDVTALAGQRSRSSQTGKWLELLHAYHCGLSQVCIKLVPTAVKLYNYCCRLEIKFLLNYVQISSPYRAVNTFGYKNQLILYREVIAVCSEIHTKHINTLCGLNVEFSLLVLAVHKVTTGL